MHALVRNLTSTGAPPQNLATAFLCSLIPLYRILWSYGENLGKPKGKHPGSLGNPCETPKKIMEKQWEHTETIGKAILSSVVSRHPLTKGFLDTAELSMKRLRGNIGDPM